jgi:hypothetical protein
MRTGYRLAGLLVLAQVPDDFVDNNETVKSITARVKPAARLQEDSNEIQVRQSIFVDIGGCACAGGWP